jgi:hypothetical protein
MRVYNDIVDIKFLYRKHSGKPSNTRTQSHIKHHLLYKCINNLGLITWPNNLIYRHPNF